VLGCADRRRRDQGRCAARSMKRSIARQAEADVTTGARVITTARALHAPKNGPSGGDHGRTPFGRWQLRLLEKPSVVVAAEKTSTLVLLPSPSNCFRFLERATTPSATAAISSERRSLHWPHQVPDHARGLQISDAPSQIGPHPQPISAALRRAVSRPVRAPTVAGHANANSRPTCHPAWGSTPRRRA